MVAMTEATSGTVRVDIDTLGSKGQVKYNDDISALLTTAHPVVYPDGSMYNLYSDVRPYSMPALGRKVRLFFQRA